MKCLLILALVATVAYASVGFSNCTSNLLNGYVPHQPTGAVQVCREGAIAISYDTVMINPAWSAYYITAQECDQTITGRLSFYQDPDLKALGVTQASVDSEVFSDAWNRGHVAPSQIMSYSKVAKKAAYTMANIAPQAATFNQQPWNRLEGYVYNFIKTKRRNLYTVTGVAYKNRANPIRNYTIAVPDYYWKVLCDADNGISLAFTAKMWPRVRPIRSTRSRPSRRCTGDKFSRRAPAIRARWTPASGGASVIPFLGMSCTRGPSASSSRLPWSLSFLKRFLSGQSREGWEKKREVFLNRAC
jgi:hypothetical protein